jgi:hypothetical protein
MYQTLKLYKSSSYLQLFDDLRMEYSMLLEEIKALMQPKKTTGDFDEGSDEDF